MNNISDAAATPPAGIDPVEAAIARASAALRACPDCGPRPEPDATYCSQCGRFLPGCCAECGAAVGQPGAHFCEQCGVPLVRA